MRRIWARCPKFAIIYKALIGNRSCYAAFSYASCAGGMAPKII
jgi:hypothetical protein